MPESFSAFCRMVSLTAAKTSRMFEVSVAWVRLGMVSIEQSLPPHRLDRLLRIEIEVSTIDLVEAPQQILGSSICVIASRVVGEVFRERRLAQLLPKKIDLVEEQNDTRPHEPSRVDHRVEKHQTFHHTVLRTSLVIRDLVKRRGS